MAARLLHQWRDQLEDYRPFKDRYRVCAQSWSLGARRNFLRNAIVTLNGQGGYACNVEGAEQLRRYFDAKYSVSSDPNDLTLNKYDYLEPVFELPDQPQPKKANSTMDKNLAALLRPDAKTVHVKLKVSGADKIAPNKTYTYVTHLPLEVGDVVAVDANGYTVLADVKKVDTEAKIEPGCETEYKWVIGKIDFAAYEANEKRNADIVAEAAVIVRENMRRSFASQVLGAASPEQRDRLLALTGNTAPA